MQFFEAVYTAMKKFARLLLPAAVLLAVLTHKAYARSDYYFGAIDKFPIVVELQRDGEKVSGWYFYRSQAREIQLTGSIGPEGSFRLYESTDGNKNAEFEGSIKDGVWQGNWHKTTVGAAPLPFVFKAADAPAGNLDGSYSCSGKRHDSIANGQYQSDLRWSLKLTIAKGRVRAFNTNQTTRMDDHSEQACSIDLGDLGQQAAKVGALLKAKNDSEEQDGRECTVRIVGDADTAVIQFGASGKDGDDCRGVGTTMFCSARGGWADLVLDRKANTCKTLR